VRSSCWRLWLRFWLKCPTRLWLIYRAGCLPASLLLLCLVVCLCIHPSIQDKHAAEDEKKAIQYQEQKQLREEEELARRNRERAQLQQQVLEQLDLQKRLKAEQGTDVMWWWW
jgi:hypothetical protein